MVEIKNDHCLWDSGAQYCTISADLVEDIDPLFLGLEIHDGYRNPKDINVQVDASFGMSNSTFQLSTIFLVVSKDTIPNQRSGIILGQYGFMDRMMVHCIPRSILVKRGEADEDTIWGEIHVNAILDLDENLKEY